MKSGLSASVDGYPVQILCVEVHLSATSSSMPHSLENPDEMANPDVFLEPWAAKGDLKMATANGQPAGVLQDQFDAVKHLRFEAPARSYSMMDLGFPADTGVSPFAVSEPFQLFTREAIQRMRDEVLNENVFKNYRYSSNLAQCQLRGYASE